MEKIDVVLNVIQAAMTYGNDARINAVYALIAVNRNNLVWICKAQPDNGDLMAEAAVAFAMGGADKPAFMSQAGL